MALANHLTGHQLAPRPVPRKNLAQTGLPDLCDVRGQQVARRALEVAAAGATGHSELEATEDLATLSSLAMWFLFGATITYLVGVGLPDWEVFAYVAAALTIIRILPIRTALIGSTLPRQDRYAVALLGPRGTASIVFGLLAWRGIADIYDASLVLYLMVLTVAGSIAFHSVGAEWVGRRYLRGSTADAAAPPPTDDAQRPGR